MGVINNQRGLQIGISTKTSFSRCKRNKNQCQTFGYFKFRNKKFIRKKSYRTSTDKQNSGRFLQYAFPSTEEKWGNETCNKFKTPKSVSQETTLQNGHNSQSFEFSQARRLGNISRSEGCLFTRKNFQKTQKVSKILCKQKGLPVQGTLLWPNISTKSFHKDSVSNSCTPKKTEYSSSGLLRRLDVCKPNETRVNSRSRDNVKSPCSTWIYSECRQIASHSYSNHNIHRCTVQTRSGPGITISRQDPIFDNCCANSYEKQCDSQILSPCFRKDYILSGIDTKCQIIYEASPITFTSKLVSISDELGLSNNMYSRAKISSEMVAVYSKHHTGSIIQSKANQCNNHNRCFNHRLGRTFEQDDYPRSLVQIDENPTHQQFGVESSSFNNTKFSEISKKQTSISKDRQCHRSSIHKQARGDTVTSTLSTGLGSVDVCITEQHDIESCSHSRTKKYIGRQLKQVQSSVNRVGIEQCDRSESFSKMGVSHNRSFCNISEQESNNILLMVPTSSSSSSGCSVDQLGGNVCICIPSSIINTQSPVIYTEVSMRGNSDSPILATTALVSATTTTSCSLSSSTTNHRRSVSSREKQNSSPRARSLKVDCMASINKRFSSKGFSENATKLLSASWRQGTQKDYQAKFRKFNSWCCERKINPYAATLENCANFLTDLFEKGLQYRTIAGYRSMLSSVLPPIEKIPVGQHPYIIRLLKGVFNSRPPVRKLIPEWDLPLVLEMLKSEPFEPLKKADLKFVTWKTVFLIAITTFRRCGDLQSLRIGEGSVNVQKKGVTFLRHGLSKQDRESHQNPTIFLPAFADNKLLDPKRALTYYLRKTEDFRVDLAKDGKDELKLFLSVNKPHKPVSSQTISKWIVNVVKRAYKKQKRTIGKVKGHSTRSLGPSWALFKGARMKDIMESADWSRPDTFVKFYLKDVQVDFLNC